MSHDKPGNTCIVCAFYTDSYRDEIAALQNSLEKLGIDYFFKRYKSRGYWEANTRIKPEFLLSCLDEFPGRPLVYLDADALVRKPLVFFDDLHADLSVFSAPTPQGFSHKYLTGTLYLANNAAIRKFLSDWVGFQRGNLLQVDQDSFEQAMESNRTLNVVPLPESYVKIFDRAGDDPVIEHFQASRKRVKLQRFLKKLRNAAGIVALIGIVVWLLIRWLNP